MMRQMERVLSHKKKSKLLVFMFFTILGHTQYVTAQTINKWNDGLNIDKDTNNWMTEGWDTISIIVGASDCYFGKIRSGYNFCSDGGDQLFDVNPLYLWYNKRLVDTSFMLNTINYQLYDSLVNKIAVLCNDGNAVTIYPPMFKCYHLKDNLYLRRNYNGFKFYLFELGVEVKVVNRIKPSPPDTRIQEIFGNNEAVVKCEYFIKTIYSIKPLYPKKRKVRGKIDICFPHLIHK